MNNNYETASNNPPAFDEEAWAAEVPKLKIGHFLGFGFFAFILWMVLIH